MSNIEEKTSKAAYNTFQQDKSNQFQASLRPRPDELRSPRKGMITKAYQFTDDTGRTQLRVEIRFDNMRNNITQTTYKSAFALSETIEDIALRYGTIDKLIGKRVVVESSSGRNDQGLATIVNSLGRGNLEQANTLKPFGTLIAPAGGMV